MANHIEKTSPALVHHPSDALDSFCRYDETSQAWLDFNMQISAQIAVFERSHLHYFKHSPDSGRRSAWKNQSR